MKYQVNIIAINIKHEDTILRSIDFDFDQENHTELEITKIKSEAIKALAIDIVEDLRGTEENLKSIIDES